MLKSIYALTLILSLLSACSSPKEAEKDTAPPTITLSPEETIRKALPQVPIIGIKTTPMAGVYELQVGSQILYADASGRYLMRGGHILDMQEKKDLTQQRLEDINRVDWASLPLDKAVLSGDPKGSQSIAVFTDPDCPYCKNLEVTLKDLKGVKVYTFLYPLEQLHPKAKAKSEAIWCSEDQHKMLQKVMLEGYMSDKDFVFEEASCETPIADIASLAKSLNIHGTPAIIASDGRRMSGAPKTAAALNNWIANK